MLKHRRLLPLLTLAACTTDAPKLATAKIDTLPGGITVTHNSGPTEWSDTNGWKVVRELVIHPAEGSPEEIGNSGWTTIDDAGRVYLVDRKPLGIRIWDSDGSYLRTVGREGAGPGEFKSPAVLVYRDTLVIFDDDLKRISLMTRDGALLKEWSPLCCAIAMEAVDDSGRIVLDYDIGSTTQHYRRFRLDGTIIDSMTHPAEPTQRNWTKKTATGAMMFVIPYQARGRLTFLRNGTLLWGITDKFSLRNSSDGRDTISIVEFATEAALLPDSVRRAVIDQKYIQQQFGDVAKLSDIDTKYPLFGLTEVDAEGNLWVSNRAPEGRLRFLVFDPSGRLRGEVPNWFPSEYIQGWSGDRFVTVEQDSTGATEIRRYRIERRGK